MSETRSCVDCGILNCHTRDKEYPDFCLTTHMNEETEQKVRHLYEEEENRKIWNVCCRSLQMLTL